MQVVQPVLFLLVLFAEAYKKVEKVRCCSLALPVVSANLQAFAHFHHEVRYTDDC